MPRGSLLLTELLKDSNYKLTQFSTQQIASFEESIILKESRGKQSPYITCLTREKEIKLTPEEAIRQLYLRVLHFDYGYPLDRIQLEYSVSFGREKKRADIAVTDKDDPRSIYPNSNLLAR